MFVDQMTNIYFTMSAVMFCVFGWSLTHHFVGTKKEIQRTTLLQTDIPVLLRKWSIRHSIACFAVYKLERYFSFILLFSISSTFCQLIATIQILMANSHGSQMVAVVMLIPEVLIFIAVCSFGDLIKNEVSNSVKKVLK